jgi:hypothetical protein
LPRGFENSQVNTMVKDMTRSKLLQIWFTSVVLIVVAGIAIGASVTVATGIMLAALCLIPPAITLMLWHRVQPPTAAEVLRGTRTLAIVLGLPLLTQQLDGAGRAQYRDFELGGDIATVAGLAGVPSSEARTIHERPAVLQDLGWRPSRWLVGSTAVSTDPVEQIVFSFYNDQLFRIVVDYGHERTEGMTNADMTEAISAIYGAPVRRLPGAARLASPIEAESGSPVARWGDAGHAVVLYRTSSYGEAFRLIVTDLPLDGMARKATTQAMHLDDQEAPRLEVARQKKERDNGRALAEKARVTNKAIFKP